MKLIKDCPKCPKCKVPLKEEGMYICNHPCCKWKWKNFIGHTKFRCPKCFKLYYDDSYTLENKK